MKQSKSTPEQDSRLDRRGFLKSSSVIAGGAAALGGLSIERGAFAQSDDTVKVALVGCGGRGSGATDQALSTSGDVKLVAMADAFKDRMDGSQKGLERKHGIKAQVKEENKFVGFDAYKNAIEMADVAILATPPGFRPIHFAEAIKQGKHVFMEKPVAVDGQGVRQVLAAAQEAKKKNLKVGVGLQRHHQLGYQEVVKRIQDGAIGDIVSARAYWNGGGVWVRDRKSFEQRAGRKLTEMEYQMRNWYYFVWLCGDHIDEQHIHNLDVINWVKGTHPVSCQGLGGREVRKGIDMFSQCRHIRGCWNSVSEHVQGTKGRSSVSGPHALTDNDGKQIWRFPGGGKNPYQQEHDDLFEAIRNDKPFNEAFYGAHSTLTAVMGRMATYSGKMVTADEALNSNENTMPEVLGWEAAPPTLPDENGRYAIPIPGKTRFS
jgi:myo-inositol 2-dehydrogenase/D-chiro-inositol 1-dehydrogenase